jgi:hypothetical protein
MFGVQTLQAAAALVVAVLAGKMVEVLAPMLERQWQTMSVGRVVELVQLVAAALLVVEAGVVLGLLGQTEQRLLAVLGALDMMSQHLLVAQPSIGQQVEEGEGQQLAVLVVLLSAVLVVQILLGQVHPQILLLAEAVQVVEQQEQVVTVVQESSISAEECLVLLWEH